MSRFRRWKVVVLGQSGCGKSSLLDRLAHDSFVPDPPSTCGAAYVGYNLDKCRFECWDTSGHANFARMMPMYYRGAHLAIIVFDLGQTQSVEQAEYWCQELVHNDASARHIYLVGNKLDRMDKTVADYGMMLSNKYNVKLLLVSAKTGEGVNDVRRHVFEKYQGLQLQQGDARSIDMFDYMPLHDDDDDKGHPSDNGKDRRCCCCYPPFAFW